MKHTQAHNEEVQDGAKMQKNKLSPNKKLLVYGISIILGLLILAGGWYGYVYASTPAHIRKPTFQHYHFRTQILVDGKAVDFSNDKFQKKIGTSTSCSAAVGSAPIDFHDHEDQLTHVHWSGMTGGEFLKDFGWNYIGGNDRVLGYRYDGGLMPSSVKIYGKLLPTVPKNATFYVYTGDKEHYQQKNWDDFLSQDLEIFFGKQSNVGHSQGVSFNVSNWLFPKAYADSGVMNAHASNKSEEELTRINNVVGNVVIFAQQNKPTDAQVKARFNSLVPLQDSTCGD
jgi:hypothetical protein